MNEETIFICCVSLLKKGVASGDCEYFKSKILKGCNEQNKICSFPSRTGVAAKKREYFGRKGLKGYNEE